MFKNSTNKYEIQFIKRLNEAANSLRQRPTIAEQRLWKYLRRNKVLGYKFRRQHAMGRYIVDFVCHQKKLIIEVDGEIHRYQKEHDRQRDQYFQRVGYRVVRFSNDQVLHKTKSVINQTALLLKGGGGSAAGGDGEGLITRKV